MSDECSEEQLKGVLRIVDEWYDAFSGSPGFALLTESQKSDAGAVTEFFAKYTYEYLGLPPTEWNAAALRECLTGILPRKVSAELPFFESVAPVLSGFFTFLEESGLLPGGGKLGEAAKNSHQDIIAAAADRRNWGPAKNFVMAAHDAGVDIRDPKALDAFLLESNLRQMTMQAKSSDAIRTGSPRQPALEEKPRLLGRTLSHTGLVLAEAGANSNSVAGKHPKARKAADPMVSNPRRNGIILPRIKSRHLLPN
jgi:hypothetical protein